MDKQTNILLSFFYITMICLIIFLGSKVVSGMNKFELEKTEVNLSMDTTYQIGIDASKRRDREPDKYKYTSSDNDIAEVSSTGLVTPVNGGTTEVSVKRGRTIKKLVVNVTDIPMDMVELSNNNIVIKTKQKYNLSNLIKKSTYTYNYTFISNDDDIITVDSNGVITGQSVGSTTVTVTTNNGVNTDINVTVISSETEATSIVIDNKQLNIKVGQSTKLNAYVYPDNASNKDITWISTNPSIVSVDNEGNITAINKGVAYVKASTNNGLTASSKITVLANKKTTDSSKPDNDGTEVTGITLDKSDVTVSVGGTVKINYTVLPITATNKNVTWSIDNKDIVSINRDGTIKGLKAGSTKATVKTYNNKTATITINVIAKKIESTGISLNITNKTINVGDSFSITATVTPANATDKNITWVSSSSNIAVVNNGRVTGVGEGIATISAKTSNGKVATAKITVNKKIIEPTKITLNTSSVTIAEGKSTTLVPTIEPSNATDKTVKWKSSNTDIATVTSGKVTGKKTGTATITATTSNGISTSASVKVVASSVPVTGISLDKTNVSLVEGGSTTLVATITPTNATDKNLIWTSSNTAVATVTNGKVTAKKAGTATITVKTSNNKKATATITVKAKEIPPTGITLNKTSLSIEVGSSATLTATITPSNATNKTVTWTSSDTAIATVANGKITAKKAGTVTITAKTSNNKNAKATVTVKAKANYNPYVKKISDASKLKLYKKRNLPDPKTKSNQKLNGFAITDIGTANEIIWYTFVNYNKNTDDMYLSGYKGNTRVYSAAVYKGGHGQGTDVEKVNNTTYKIYAQGMGGKSVYSYNVTINSKYNSTYTNINATNSGVKFGSSVEVSVDPKSGYAVTKTGTTITVYKYNSDYTKMFTNSNKIRTFTIAHPSSVQGGDLAGHYYYYIWGGYTTSGPLYIYCYDILTGKVVWNSTIKQDSIKTALKNQTGTAKDYKSEPEGCKVIYYKGSYKLFIGYKTTGYTSSILYFDV